MKQKLLLEALKSFFIRAALWGILVYIVFASNPDNISNLVGSELIIFLIFALTPTTFFILNIVRMIRGGGLWHIKKFCKQFDHPKVMMARLEKTWEEGFQTRSFRIDEEYLIYTRKMHAKVVSLANIDGVQYDMGVYPASLFLRDNFFLYLKNGQKKICIVRPKEGAEAERYFKEHTKGITIGKLGDRAKRLVAKRAVGKINFRYRIMKLGTRYFIVDFASPHKLSNYYPFSMKKRVGTPSLDAWEITKDELEQIKYKKYRKPKVSDGIKAGIGVPIIYGISRMNIPGIDMQGWTALIFVALIFIGFIMYMKLERFDTSAFLPVKILQKQERFVKLYSENSHVGMLVFYLMIFVGMIISTLFIRVNLFFPIVTALFIFGVTFVKFLQEYPLIDTGYSVTPMEETTD